MNTKKQKAITDDGMNPELVRGAMFDGIFEIPIIRKPTHLLIPDGITPLSMRYRHDIQREAIGFHEMDIKFADILRNPQDYVEDFGRGMALISPDCSLYRDAPLTVQIANVYHNRAIGHYYQHHGIYVIPQVRWGNDLTYTTKAFPEKIAFLGVEKHSIVAIGTYGSSQPYAETYHVANNMLDMDKKDSDIYNPSTGYFKNPKSSTLDDAINGNTIYLNGKPAHGTFTYVLDESGNIIFGKRFNPNDERKRSPHPTLLGGKDPLVQCAGIITFEKGKIVSVNYRSGHFRPNVKSLDKVNSALDKLYVSNPELFSEKSKWRNN